MLGYYLQLQDVHIINTSTDAQNTSFCHTNFKLFLRSCDLKA